MMIWYLRIILDLKSEKFKNSEAWNKARKSYVIRVHRTEG